MHIAAVHALFHSSAALFFYYNKPISKIDGSRSFHYKDGIRSYDPPWILCSRRET